MSHPTSSTLFVITTYNQSEVTKACLDSLSQIDDIDILVVDDASTDDTLEICSNYDVRVIEKDRGYGLTDSWNRAYRYFERRSYRYLVIANNDILVPKGSISEMRNVLDKWPSSLVVPMSTRLGAGHQPEQCINNHYGNNEYETPENYQQVQDLLMQIKDRETKSNNLYKFDPIRMKHFNGFFFMMNRNICQYEREDGNLFDPKFINVKNEDEFNWAALIPNNDYAMLCKTSFVFHWKGVSFTKAGIDYSNNFNQLMEQRENKLNTTVTE